MQKQISFTNGVQVESDSSGIVMFPSDLGIDVNTATRDWLAVRTIDDLVTASGGLYVPPAKFRPTTVPHG
jgi:malonate decarboxylase alpha subunit